MRETYEGEAKRDMWGTNGSERCKAGNGREEKRFARDIKERWEKARHACKLQIILWNQTREILESSAMEEARSVTDGLLSGYCGHSK